MVGDPLCAPFAAQRPAADDLLIPALDPATELPAFFAERRLKAVQEAGIALAALQGWLRAEARYDRGDTAGAREALEPTIAAEPRLLRAQHLAAAIHEQTKQYDLAVVRYRAILQREPDDPLALNNLAYSLAVHQKNPTEALPLARRAFDLLKSVETADTLGWTLHLTGDSSGAALLFSDIVRSSIRQPEILLHAAIVFASAGRPDAAAKELEKAIALDATLETREDVKTLRARIARPATDGDSPLRQVHK